MKSYLLLSAVMFLLMSCVKPDRLESTHVEMSPYFDIKGLIAKQISMLEKEGAKVSKQTAVNQREEALQATAEVNWEKELGLFADADINKNILATSYQIDTTINEAGTILVYTALENDLRVRKIEVVEIVDGLATSLKAEFQEENMVYAAKQYLTMTLGMGKVEEYQVRGFQKMTGQDTLFYHVEATVLWP